MINISEFNSNTTKAKEPLAQDNPGRIVDTVLLVEDDVSLREIIAYNLQLENYRVITATDGEKGLRIAREARPQLVILDVMLPKMSGFSVCRILRKESRIPIMILTGKTEEVDKLNGFALGADDYVTKPFSMRELLARVRAMIRRIQVQGATSGDGSYLKLGEIKIDINRHRISQKGIALELSPKEYDLFVFLARNKGVIFDRDTLLDRVWGNDFLGDVRTVDVHIWSLRQKLEEKPEYPKHIITVRGEGYKFEL